MGCIFPVVAPVNYDFRIFCRTKEQQQRKKRSIANTYKIRDDFIIETNYYDFHHKAERAFDNIHQPAFITHRAYPTNQKKAKHLNSDVKNNQEMFKMISQGMCEGSRRVFQEENAGGCSIFSETLSCEIVTRMFNAQLTKTEMEIDYVNEHCKKTDFLVVINGKKYGVSVTRAFKYIKPNKNGQVFDHFSMEDATVLLKKKLEGVTTANKCVQNEDVWQKQILHIFTPNANVTKVLKRAYMDLKHSLRHNTIVMVTEATNMDCIFTERFYDHIF
ncbi:predicted protein [Naegleria gruberi]|uniref:Predicted protein n=1 Tax=Naegleria gruberi TaxID=5762 RepID=D2V6B2_NAEGR|nr:uncharacterized protein NAEGRDRAFT_64373 [Naegleria gruberi]EFC47541.1 predicted protein [Naegleria gruberi]|eukprot:XP_002680285.1 predicted protein [Naegleria gruberi strain NEG-M]